MFKIMAIYKGGEAKKIDSADDKESAEYLLHEYRLIYGTGWTVFIQE